MEEIPILILHGWQVPVERYLPLKKFLSKAGFKVFVPNLPGFSKSEISSKVYTLDDYVKFVVDFVEKNKLDSFFLIGHSFGGRVAVKLAALYPQKIKALVLTGVPAIKNKRFKRLVFLILAKIGRIFFLIPPLCFLKKWSRKILYYLVGEWDYYKAKGSMRQTFKKIVAEDLGPALSEIKVPTLLVWGERDQVIPVSVAQKIAAKIPRAKLTVVPSGSHKLPYQKPRIFFERFLRVYQHGKL